MSHLQRRELIALLGSAAAWPIAARAQQLKMPTIGYLRRAAPRGVANRLRAFKLGLGDFGYVDGRNVMIEYYCADCDSGGLAELVRAKPTVIVTESGSCAGVIARQVTDGTAIVSLMGGDPVKLGLVADLNRPGGNITGAKIVSVNTVQEELQELAQLVPNAGALALLTHGNSPYFETSVQNVQAASRTLNRRIPIYKVNKNEDVLHAVFASTENMIATATRDALDTIYREFVTSGGVIRYGPRIYEALRQMGRCAGQILNGENVSNLPVRQFTDINLITNLKTATRLGLDVPPTLPALADD